MGENFVEQFEKSSKSLDKRAGYTRKFLKKQKISNEDFIGKAENVGVVVSNEDIYDNKVLVSKVYEIQSAIKLKRSDSREGTDGMFGHYTLGKLKTFVRAKTERKDVSTGVAEGGTVVGGGVDKKDYKPEERDKNPDEKVYDAPKGVVDDGTKSEFSANKSETPKENLDRILGTFPGKSEIVRLAGNGGRQVVIYVPQGFDSSKPVEIDYHFHGTYSNWVDVPIPKLEGTSAYYDNHVGKFGVGANRFNQSLSSAQKHGNMILVYPLSAGQRGPVGSVGYRQGYDQNWMKNGNSTNDDMARLHKETLEQLNTMLGHDVNSPSILPYPDIAPEELPYITRYRPVSVPIKPNFWTRVMEDGLRLLTRGLIKKRNLKYM